MCMKEMNLNYVNCVHEGDDFKLCEVNLNSSFARSWHEVGTKLARSWHTFSSYEVSRSFTKFHTGPHTKMSFLRASSVAHSDVTMVSPDVTMVPPGATETPSPSKKLRGAMFDAPGTVHRQSSTVSAPPRSAFTRAGPLPPLLPRTPRSARAPPTDC